MEISDTASTISLMEVHFLSTTAYFLHLLKRQRLSTFYRLRTEVKKTVSNHRRLTNPNRVREARDEFRKRVL